MTTESPTQIANFIWSICNLLRGPYKRNEYRKVILPLTVLGRFDCILMPSKLQVLAEHAKIKTKGKVQLIDARQFWVQMEKSLGNKRDGEPEPDTDLRDTEMVPLKESIHEYFKREVLPHVPDAWIDEEKPKIGYEIPLNRHFYQYEPPRELEVIAAYLDEENAKLDALVAKVETAIERLREYRTALITAAVTGMIDVSKEDAS